MLYDQGDCAAARKYYEEALAAKLRLTEALLGTLSEAETLAYLDKTQLGRDPLLSVLGRLPGSSAEQAYQPVWDSRALATRALAVRRPPPDADRTVRDLWDRLRLKRAELTKLALAVVPPAKAHARQKRLAELTGDKEELERQLAKASDAFRRQQRLQRVGFAALAARLPANAALLDLVRFTFYESPATRGGKWKYTPHYDAFVLRPSPKAPGYTLAWLHLGEARPLDDAAASWRQWLLRRAAATGEAPERALRQLLWQKVEEHLSGCTAVVIVPDGTLTTLPWAALPGRRPGSYLLEDYALSTVAYGQHLYDLLTRKPATGDRALAVGGVLYNAVPPSSAGERLALAHRGPALDAGARPQWGYLEGSRREAEAVADLWRPRRVDLLKGTAASEAALRQRLPGVRYVHLATHGFFADAKFRSAFRQDVTGERLRVFDRPLFGRRATITGRNPLLLSGVVLAGANVAQGTNECGAPVGDDGILTAEEVVEMDLSAAELVVLSACETGQGMLEGEGVFGLQRAFGLAGARTTIASLWKVDDAATQRLMTLFYDNLWHKKLPRVEALRQAQLTMLRGEGKEGGGRGFEVAEEDGQPVQRRLHPRLWAAWTLSGDPGDLSAVVPVVLDTEQHKAAALMAAAVVVPVWSWFVGGAALGATLGVVFLRRRRR